MITEEKQMGSLSEKRISEIFTHKVILKEKDVKEKIQNAQRRLKAEAHKKGINGLVVLTEIYDFIDKVFKEEFGEKLI